SSGTTARLTNGNWNRVLSAAYTKSQCASIVVPEPTVAPCTAAITGLSKLISAVTNRSCTLSPGFGGFRRKSSRSLPAVNESPAPCKSTTLIPASCPAALIRSATVEYMFAVSAFFLAGRLNWMRRRLPDCSVTISLVFSAAVVTGGRAFSSISELMSRTSCAREVRADHQIRILGGRVALTDSRGAHETEVSAEAGACAEEARRNGPLMLDVLGEQMAELLSLGLQVALVLDGSACDQ